MLQMNNILWHQINGAKWTWLQRCPFLVFYFSNIKLITIIIIENCPERKTQNKKLTLTHLPLSDNPSQ